MGFLNAFGAIGRVLLLAAVACVAAALVIRGDALGVLFVIALPLGISGLVFASIGGKLGRVSSLDRMLRDVGVAGTATITSIRETGVTVNGSPVVEFTLQVDSAAHAPFEAIVKQRTPRLLVGSILPGSRLAVVVDPADKGHLAIDWEASGEAAASDHRPPDDDAATTLSRMRDADHLLATGTAASAIITSMEDVGDMSELGLVEIGEPGDDDRLFVIGLEVKQPGLDPYSTRVAHRVPERLAGRVGPRTQVKVAVDRDDDTVVAIDWDSLGH